MTSTTFCQPPVNGAPDREDPDKLRARRQQLLEREIEYLTDIGYTGLVEYPLELDRLDVNSRLAADLEWCLFRQMNLSWRLASEARAAMSDCPDEDEIREIERWANRGDAIRNTIAVVFSKLAISIASRFGSVQYSVDELLSEANTTLLHAITKFNPDRGFRFSTYATHALRRRLLRFLQQQQRHHRRFVDCPHEALLPEVGRWTEAYQRRVESGVAEVEDLLSQLTSRERYVIRSRFGWGREFEPRTLQAIANELEVSRERVRQLEARALRKLRAAAEQLQSSAF